ncbi:MAG: FAD-binding protein [Deltaproteobacteria bacterium]|nr:FAD-binding protein [Deltaproteobacteria bacterium]
MADVLVLGCGPAGLMAAVEARKRGCRVVAVDKGIIGNDCAAVGAKQLAATGPWAVAGDSARLHYEDTLRSGCFINNDKLAYLLASKIGPVVMALERMGMPFDRDPSGKNIQVLGPSPGHSKARSLRFSDITGKLLVDTLYAECRRRGVELLSEHVALDLVSGEKGVSGVLVVDLVSGELGFIRTKAVIVATGGIGCLYELTSNPVQNTADGIALALRAGAELMDLEFVQFYPVTVLFPPAIRGMNLNSHHYGAHLINVSGERFMSRYYPEQMEHVTRDKLSQCIFEEITAGRCGPNGGVFMDATMIAAEVYAREIPSEWHLAKTAGVDLTKEKLEVAPSAHYYMGGIRIDERCRTTVPGLFAAGECCAGAQGANRLANNGLSEALVFGSIAGKNAAEYASKAKISEYREMEFHRRVSQIEACFDKKGSPPSALISSIRQVMTRHVGIVREAKGLKTAVQNLQKLTEAKIAADFGNRWDVSMLQALSARNMLLVAQGIALAACERRESRGAHYRSDYPHMDDSNWRSNIVVTLKDHKRLTSRIEAPGSGGNFIWNVTK